MIKRGIKRIMAAALALAMLLGSVVCAQAEELPQTTQKVLELEFAHFVARLDNGKQEPLEEDYVNVVDVTVTNVCGERTAQSVELVLSGENGLEFSLLGKTGRISIESGTLVCKEPQAYAAQAAIDVGDLAYEETATYRFALRFADPEADVVTMNVQAQTAQKEYAAYSCEFDVGRDAYAIVIGGAAGNGGDASMRNDIAMMTEIFEKGYFNGRKIDVFSLEEPEDLWPELDGITEQIECDENDIAYVYISAHGFTNIEEGAIALYNSADDVRGCTVYYKEIYEYFQERLPCETVFIFDNCYSGRAIAAAQTADLGEQYHVLTVTTADHKGPSINAPTLEDLKSLFPDMLRSWDADLNWTGKPGIFTAMGNGLEAIIDAAIAAAKLAAPTADLATDLAIPGKMQVEMVLEEIETFMRTQGEKHFGQSLWPFDRVYELYTSFGYSLFVKHLSEGISSGEADAGGNGIVALAEAYNYVLAHAEVDELLERLLSFAGTVLAPQHRSQEPALPLVMLTPEARYVEPLTPTNEQRRYGAAQTAAVIVTASIEKEEQALSSSQISRVTVHLLGGEDGAKEAQVNAAINSNLSALYGKAKELADRAPKTAQADGKSAFYKLRLQSVSAAPGASLHLSFYEIHNLDARNRTQPSEFSYAYDLTTGEREAADGEEKSGAPDIGGLGIDDLLDPANPQAREQLAQRIAQALGGVNLIFTQEETAEYLLSGEKGSWMLTDEGFYAVFDLWEVTMSRADGMPEVKIPYSELSGILAEQYIPGTAPAVQATADGEAAVFQYAGEDAQGYMAREGVLAYGEGTRLGLRALGTVTDVLAVYHPVDGYGVSGAVVGFATSLTDAAIWLPDVEDGAFEITWTDKNGAQSAMVTIGEGGVPVIQ